MVAPTVLNVGRHHWRFALAAMLLAIAPAAARASDWTFPVEYSKDVHTGPFSGRVCILFSKMRREPRTGPGWFKPELFVSRDVENWMPGETITFTSRQPDGMLAHPVPLEKMKLAGYRAQAVARFNPHVRNVGTGAGNGYSQVVRVESSSAGASAPTLVIDQLVEPKQFSETKWTKLLDIRSEKLSEFHGRDVELRAAVTLPASYYDQPERRYPVIFNVPGFGGTHFHGIAKQPVPERNAEGVEFLRVMLDPSCPRGHHVFADSANNGPVGTAFIEEFLPAFDEAYRSVAAPTARFLTGHSSGGWSSLWLQVTYPESFGGTWSTAPDPVDFRDFQLINLYRPDENMYVDAAGERRPLARRNGKVLLWYQDFAEMEWTLGYGGQLHSFEAAFSHRMPDGKPALMWDRTTGRVDTDVARTWETYDIRLVLERNWKTLGPKLAGKLHVFMGDADTFYLDGATKRLAASLRELGSDAVVEIHPGKDHGSLLDRPMRDRIRHEMVEAYLKHHTSAGDAR